MPCFLRETDFRKKPLQSLQARLSLTRLGGAGLLLLLMLATVVAVEAQADACGTMVLSPQSTRRAVPTDRVHQNLASPIISESGFVMGNLGTHDREENTSHMWFRIDNAPTDARAVLLESVWGIGPDSMSAMWGRVHVLRNGYVHVEPHHVGPQRDQPFSLGVRARFVLRDGSLSAPSLPVFITHTGKAVHHDGVGAATVMMFLCCAALFGLWVAYRRESDPVYRIRLAAATALISLFFLSVAPALSWTKVEDPAGRLDAIDCHLGDEAQCATYVPDAGPNPMSTSDAAAERRFELASWMGASSALRVGLVWCLILLLPALIWLMVVPTLRPAQAAVAFGASAAGYTFLAALFYRLCTPSWLSVEATRAFDLTLLTSGSIFVAIGLMIRWSLRLASQDQAELPPAVARRM